MFRFANLNLERGTAGVFEVEDLVAALRLEKCSDIWVIEVPARLNLYEHMVLASCRSRRHLRAASENVRKVYKLKREEGDTVPSPEP